MSIANKASEDSNSSSEAFVSNGAGNDISAFSQSSSVDSSQGAQAQTQTESESESKSKSEFKSQCDSELTSESEPASKPKESYDAALAGGKDDEIDAWQKLYISFRHRRFWCFVFLGVWGLRLPLLFWLTEEQQSLDDILYLRDFDLWFSVPAPLLAALLFLFLGRTKAALAGTALVVLAFALLLDRDPEFALSRPEIMCAAITIGVIWTIWALAGRIKVLKSLGL